jgi:non-specific serine/threonine protein kinase/serine/threonine-protein kinase
MPGAPKSPESTWVSGLESLLPDDPSRVIPDVRIGPYRLLEKLGEGGMGTVWVAEQTEPVRRRVALKVIKAGMDSELILQRFEAERQALALMDHRSIATVLDAGSSETGLPYFVMELVNGVPITTYCDEQKTPVRERLKLFEAVCHAIQHAHQKGIIHRDIKPANVLVSTQDGEPVPKVIDFGVAKALHHQRLTDRPMYTEIGALVGTLEYMSPEQTELNTLDIDTRADVYALGVLLYVLLTGTTPLDAKRLRSAPISETLRLIREEDPPKPSARLTQSGESLPELAAQRHADPARLTREVRGELDWIVMKALEKDRTRRYEAASALARDVERYLHHQPVEAGPPTTRYRVTKFLRRHRVGALSAAAGVVLLVAGAAVSTWQAVRAMRAERNAAAVSEFLQNDLLGQADLANQTGEGGGRDPDVKVRTLLDRAARTIEGKFREQPLTEAAIRLTVGKAYRALGHYPEAQRQLERSVELFDANLGPDHPDTLRSKSSLAYLYGAQAKFDQAERLSLDVVKSQAARLGANHPDTLTSKNDLAQQYRAQKKYDQAEPLYLQVIQADTATLGADHPETLRARNNLAALYRDQGRYDKAEPLYEDVVRARTLKLGADHPDTLVSKNGLAWVYKEEARYQEAEALFREVVLARTAKLGADHPDTLTTKNNLALLYQAGKRNDLAEPLFREVVEGSRQKLGPVHNDTRQRIRNLILCYEQLGQTSRARALRQELDASSDAR